MASDRCIVEVLGPLRVSNAAGVDVTPAGVLQRRLLALLVLRRGEVVSVDAAIDALWPSDPPRDAVAALQNHLSRLRRLLPTGVVESVASGYRLDPSRIDVDVDRLASALDAGVGDEHARTELHELLQRWRGPAYPELEDADAARADAAPLEELRIRAIETLAGWRLAAGDTEGLVADLTALADRHPLSERPAALLMSALAATGRTAEALRVYDDFRRLLGAELGIAPSPSLEAQQAALLGGELEPTTTITNAALPVPAAPLIGRESLLNRLLTQAAAARLVTLVGPGGVGKTRLMTEAGHRLRGAAPGRPVVFCDLTQADPATAVDAVASALGIDARPGVATIGRVVDVLGDDEVVLLIDNCEHVLDPVAELVDRVVRACRNVTVLATSRERLRVPGEHVCAVTTLLDGDDESPAIELFVQRSRAVHPGFDPDGEERERVAEIVRRLDGLPLAIELAAVRLHTHDLSELVAGLDRPLSLLSTGYRTSSRHASLEAVVAWSYGLLDDELGESFVALSVFTGAFSSHDAAAVCGIGSERASDVLGQLVERSLLVRVPGRRFAMLATLRAFASERLVASGRGELVGRRHAERMVEWAEDAGRRMHVHGESALADVDDSIPELRSALKWLLDHRHVESAGRLVAALLNYAVLRLRPDVLSWSQRVLAVDPGDHSPLASQMWAASAYAAWMAGDLAETGVRSIRAVDVGARGEARLHPVVATMRGNFDLFEGRLIRATDWYGRAAEVADDPTQRLMTLGAKALALGYAGDFRATELADSLVREVDGLETALAAYVWYCAGEAVLAFDVELARARLVRAVELAELTKASFVRGVAGASHASIAARSGDPHLAADEYRWLIRHWQRAGMWSTQWTMLRSIVGLLERLGRDREAATLEGAVRSTSAGHRIFGADESALRDVGARLRRAMGDEAYAAALGEGAVLDGEAAVEHALRSL